MDKLKLLTYSVIGLILLNIGIICFLYISNLNSNQDENRRRPKDIIIEKLHFNDNQIKKYEVIIEAHKKLVDSLNKNNREIKAELYSKLKLSNFNVKVKDSLIQLILLNQKSIEEANFMHFQDIKKICTKSQLEDFNSLTEELEKLFSNQNRRPRPEFRHPPRPNFDNKDNKAESNFSSPPPMDEHRPPPPPRDGDHPRGPREGNRPPPPHWGEDRPGQPGDENRPPPPPRE
jgi:protein CpxP